MPYKAFVSYSHAVDGKLAPALQAALHRLAKPWYRLRALRVFRDKTSLSANPALWPSIEHALGESDYFLLLASPEATRSPWVEREVGWWLAHRPVDRLLILLTGGELVWDDAAGDYDWTRTTAVSPQLRGRFADEPLHVDLRWARTADDLSLRHSQFRAAALDVAATLHGRPKDDLDGEDVRLHRAARRLATAATCLLAVLTIVAGSAAYVAHRQAEVAERRRREADRERRIALGRQLAAEAEVARTHAALLPRSLLLAVEAARRLEGLGVHSAEVDHTLRDGLAILPARGDSLPQSDAIAAAMSADGRRAAAVGRDGSARVWELDGRREVGRLTTGGRLSAAAFSPDLAWLATVAGDDQQVVQLWDVASGKLRCRVVHDGWVKVLAFAPDSRSLAAGGLDRVVRVVALPDGQELVRLAHRSMVNAIAWSRDGRLLATGTGSTTDRMVHRPPQDDAAHVWDVATGRRLARLAHDHVVQAVAFAPDASLLATGSLDRTARLWDVRTGTEVARVLHEDGVGQVTFAPDGRTVASGSQPYILGWQNQTVRVWETSGREIGRVVHEGGVRSIAFSPDGRYLASAGADHTARLLDPSGHEIARMVLDHPVDVVLFSADGRTLLAAGGEVRVWPATSGFEATLLEEPTRRLPDGVLARRKPSRDRRRRYPVRQPVGDGPGTGAASTRARRLRRGRRLQPRRAAARHGIARRVSAPLGRLHRRGARTARPRRQGAPRRLLERRPDRRHRQRGRHGPRVGRRQRGRDGAAGARRGGHRGALRTRWTLPGDGDPERSDPDLGPLEWARGGPVRGRARARGPGPALQPRGAPSGRCRVRARRGVVRRGDRRGDCVADARARIGSRRLQSCRAPRDRGGGRHRAPLGPGRARDRSPPAR